MNEARSALIGAPVYVNDPRVPSAFWTCDHEWRNDHPELMFGLDAVHCPKCGITASNTAKHAAPKGRVVA